jgi:hypothetical protein
MEKTEYQKIYRDKNRERYNEYMREWRLNNLEKHKEICRRTYRKNREKILARQKVSWRSKSVEYHREKRKEYLSKPGKKELVAKGKRAWEISLNGRYGKYKKIAREYNRKFALEKKEFDEITKSPCHYCNIKKERMGVDRKNNRVGYITKNCVPCCKECNFFKGAISYSKFIKMCKRISDNLCK